jgi:hypothetical protein
MKKWRFRTQEHVLGIIVGYLVSSKVVLVLWYYYDMPCLPLLALLVWFSYLAMLLTWWHGKVSHETTLLAWIFETTPEQSEKDPFCIWSTAEQRLKYISKKYFLARDDFQRNQSLASECRHFEIRESYSKEAYQAKKRCEFWLKVFHDTVKILNGWGHRASFYINDYYEPV